MKRFLILLIVIFSSQLMAETYIIEMKHSLGDNEIKKAQGQGATIELFDQTATPYFKRTYRVEIEDLSKISFLPIKLTERIYRAVHLSLEPQKDSLFVKPDRLFHYQWGLLNQGQKIKKLIGNTKVLTIEGKSNVDIRWSEAITKVEAGLKRDPVVAVVDMGIDLDHPDLKDRIFKNRFECGTSGEILDNDEDKDKNGFKGDCMGWNFAARNMYEARRPYDDNGHGTHVSGIMAAASNAEGVVGVSSKIKILPIRVTGNIDETSDRKNIQPLTDRIAKGILYATNMGVDVINLSLGWTKSMDTKYLQEALDYAISKGVVLVAAAGNNNNNATIFPCSKFEVICVGAASIDGSLADFSNYGGEVDILAPGEEIVSTIPMQSVPLQLNLQGYDVRSGTSQAAPFVSAVAALIRANFPKMHRDDVRRRILDSADPGIPGKSLAGMLNLKGAFEIAVNPSVKPVFKNLSLLIYDQTTTKLSFNLPIKNLGSEVKDVRIKLESLSSSVNFDKAEFVIPQFRPGEVVMTNVSGVVLDQMAHNKVKIKVAIFDPVIGEKEYFHELRVSRDFFKSSNSRNLTFSFQDQPLPVGIVRDGEFRNLINTVETLKRKTGLPEYYLSKNLKEPVAIELRIFRAEGDSIKEVPGKMSLPEAIQLLNVTQLDANLDGEDDYLIRAIACEVDCTDPAKARRYIQYSYWKKDLTPLFGDKSFFKFLPTLFNVDVRGQRFYHVKHKDLGSILVPSFIETGVIPEAQQIPQPFTALDKSKLRRVYFLEPVVMNESQSFEIKTLFDTELIQSIKNQFLLSSSEDVQALHMLTQTEKEAAQGEVRVLVSIGKGFLRKNVLLTLGADKISIDPFAIRQNLWGHEFVSSVELESGLLKDSFAGLVSSNRLVFNHGVLNKSYSYHAVDSVEVPLSTVASFSDQSNEYTFFQTPSYLIVGHQNSQGTKFGQLKLNRFSFLPGALFNDSFYPVTVHNDVGNNLPALYVDETDIQSNLVSFSVFSEGELKTPIAYSAFIPPICKPMNPVRIKDNESYSLTLLCLHDKQWVLKFVQPNQ